MADLQQTLREQCYGRDLAERKTWYSPAASAYHQVRPRYPQALIDQVIEIAQLSRESKLLEIGCGPAIATPAFAALCGPIVCIEPNPDFYDLAQQTCQPYANVTLQNCAFEEWQLPSQKFDAVLAASSFHWISPEIGYPKAAAALRPNGYLILLWNKELQPDYDRYQQLLTTMNRHAPSLKRAYEDTETQIAILNELGQQAIASGQFKDLVSGHLEVTVTYSIDQYLLLLNTYSPYLRLGLQEKQSLFEALRQELVQTGDPIQLSYVSVFHIAQPN